MLIAIILVNVFIFLLSTGLTLPDTFQDIFGVIHTVSVVIFTLEYTLRVISCVYHPSGRFHNPVGGRIKYLVTPLMLIDLVAILPFYLGHPLGIDLIVLRLFRILSILKITHYSPALGVLRRVLRREAKTLLAIFLLMLVLLLVISTLIYLIEKHTSSNSFNSVFDAIWWAMATLSTVGYGDIVPTTTPGKIFGILIMMIGIGMFAIPTGILVTGFAQEAKRRDFIVVWNLVAKVPAFTHLRALEIANISSLLHLQTAMPGEVVFYKDDEADSMYFIVEGCVEAHFDAVKVTLYEGDFFGEVSLLFKKKRTGTVMAKTLTELLRLDKKDFDSFLESNHDIRDKITKIAEERIAREPGE
ncbi:MAG: cyclic nucleotide-gated ion channel [Gammaproteobacteria bacterium]